MNSLKDYSVVIKPDLKQAYLYNWLDSNYNRHNKIELVYSDNLEDINTQLLFYGYKIIKCSKCKFLQNEYYDIQYI